MNQPAVYVEPDRLAIGMFVILELSWLKHPFTFNSFVIRSEDEIATLRSLGLEKIRIDPLRSRIVVAAAAPEAPRPSDSAPAPAAEAVSADKALRIEKNRELRNSMAQAERQALKAAQMVRDTSRMFFSEPARAIANTDAVIGELAQSLLSNSDVMVHLLNDKVAGEEVYHHSLNVAMLALLLGKASGFDAAMLHVTGMAAIFHDLGKENIPSRVLLKTEALTHAEEELLRQHPDTGARLAREAGLPAAIVDAILQHHENLDGSGYPQHLGAAAITPAARVIAIVNHYDNLCNPLNVAHALTPYEALSTMFARRKNWFDTTMLGKLVRLLGVYPPGSIVRLSSGATGMVISVNSAHPLQPQVLVHDASVPKTEALILDLEQTPEISISRALRPAQLAPSVVDYLSPRRRITYYFGEENKAS